MPGSGNLLSGQTVYVKLRHPEIAGPDIERWLVCADAERTICGGLKMANGTNSQKKPPFPDTRGKAAALVRAQFVKAEAYRDKLARAKQAKDRPEHDLGLEVLLEVMAGKRVVHHHTHRHDDVITVLRLAKEFGFPGGAVSAGTPVYTGVFTT